MPRKSTKELADALREAEAELEAATKRSEVDAAAKKVMRAKEALKAVAEDDAGTTRRAASRGAAKVGVS